MSRLPLPFPDLDTTDDVNPAIRLFGKRFRLEQGPVELLAEFLSVALCVKRLGYRESSLPIPRIVDLVGWPRGRPLEYNPPIKLSLKLFAFLSASRVDKRDQVHIDQHKALVRRLEERIEAADGDKAATVDAIEDFLRGLQGAGFNRTWCAQSFYPVSLHLLTQETIWNETVARRNRPSSWLDTIQRFNVFYSVSKHRFLSRGGEVLYLQLCNALVRGSEIGDFATRLRQTAPDCLTDTETDPEQLHAALTRGLERLRGESPKGLDRLVEAIEGLDPHTAEATNARDGSWLKCEWCPADSWPEGFLFAVELSRVLQADIGPMERLELLTIGCSLQVLRSLCAQSARHDPSPDALSTAPLGFAWLFTPLEGVSRQLRLAAQRNLQVVQALIQRALRSEELKANAQSGSKSVEALYREADTKYGHKLLLSLGKRLGLVTPRRGAKPRFAMTDAVLRYLVVALLRPGERCTYEEFLQRLFAHYGIAIEGRQLNEAVAWSGLPPSRSLQPTNGQWLAAMLQAGGFLVDLSDACSIVRNNYGAVEERSVEVRA